MYPCHPKSTLTDTLFPYTTLFRSPGVDATAGTTTKKYSYADESTNSSATGKVDFTNSAGGIVGFNGVGNVNLNAGGDVTILNQGEVRGTTFAQSSGGKSASNSSYASITVVDGKGGSSFTEEQSGSNSYVSTGGGVSGTYAGAKDRKNFSRSEEHTSELQSLMRISYAAFCLKKKQTD